MLTEFPSPSPAKAGWPCMEPRSSLSATPPHAPPWPRVSIVTPSYNQADYLEETILSVLNQGYPNLEYIIMDGGSTDGSADIISKYADRLAYWVSEPDEGQADAINKGFTRATGEIVAYLNSDDTYLPNALATVVAAFQADPKLALVHGDSLFVDPAGKVIGRKRAREGDFLKFFLSLTNPISQPSAFMRRSALDAIGGVDSTFHLVMDYDLWSQIGLRGMKIKRIPADLSLFRVHSESKTTQNVVAFAEERWKIVEKCLADPVLAPRLASHRKHLYAVAHLHFAGAYWFTGQTKSARDHYWKAICTLPSLALRRRGLSLLLRFILRRRSLRRRLAESI